MTAHWLRSLLVLLAIGVATGACGRKTGLDTPYQASLDRQQEARDNDEAVPPDPKPPVTDRPFFLDRLIR